MIEWRRYIISDPRICHGQLCAKDTRVLLTNSLDSLAERASREDILRSYPAHRCGHRLCSRTGARRKSAPGCLARDLEARLLQQQAAALPHDGMVINQQDRDRGSHFIARLAGTQGVSEASILWSEQSVPKAQCSFGESDSPHHRAKIYQCFRVYR